MFLTRTTQLAYSLTLLWTLWSSVEASRKATEATGPRWLREDQMRPPFRSATTGSTVRFQCRVAGNPAPTVEWFKNGRPIGSSNRIGGFKLRQHGQMLVLKSVVPSDDATYTCDARNEFGSIFHDYGLGVKARMRKPIIDEGIFHSQAARVGDNVTFRCKILGGGNHHIRWARKISENGEDVLKIIKTSGPEPSDSDEVFKISNVTLADAGAYSCLVSNAIGRSHKTTLLHVLDGTPRWANRVLMERTSRLHMVLAGNTVNLPCHVLGFPRPTMEWFHNGRRFSWRRRNGISRFQDRREILRMETVVPEDNGRYLCRATNKFGSINYTYVLDVREASAGRPLAQIRFPKNQTIHAGDNVTFRCLVLPNTPDIHHVQWVQHIQIDGNWVNPETNTPYYKLLQPSDAKVLILENVTQEDAGKYTCLSGNSVGLSHDSAWLTVLPE